jgi:hypothetical protein
VYGDVLPSSHWTGNNNEARGRLRGVQLTLSSLVPKCVLLSCCSAARSWLARGLPFGSVSFYHCYGSLLFLSSPPPSHHHQG